MPRHLEEPGDVELDPATDARVRALIDQADRNLEEVRANFRWGRAQLALVRRAARLHGVPYQTYLKQAAVRQALSELQDAQAAAG